VPALAIAVLRPDLRKVLKVTVPASLPFAATEFLFYPSYWRPKFLFDLADRIGFGIEDVLFVAALGALTSTVYPFAARRAIEPAPATQRPDLVPRALALLGVALLATAALHWAGVRMIYGACLILVLVTFAMITRRRDLALPSLAGALLTCVVYGGLCLVFAAILPGVFDLAWNTARFSNVFVAGIPLEELLYATSTGFAGTAFYPFVTGARFVRNPV
jgi:hypothetical protein